MTPRDVFNACWLGTRVGIATAFAFGSAAVIAALVHAAHGAPGVETLGLLLCAVYALLSGVWSTHCALMRVRRCAGPVAPAEARGVVTAPSAVVIDVRSRQRGGHD